MANIPGCSPPQFDSVAVLNYNLPGRPPEGISISVITGIAGINLQGDNNNDFTRCDLTFLVPVNDAGEAIEVGADAQLSGIVWPATFEKRSGAHSSPNFGWGVDTFNVQHDGDNVRVTARIAVEGIDSYFIRVGFQVIIILPILI